MRRRIGALCMVLGAVCLLSAVGFLVFNHWEAESAKTASQTILADVHIQIENKLRQPAADSTAPENTVVDETVPVPTCPPMEVPTEMETVLVAEDECIGVLTIPALALEFPVLTQWNYSKLKKAPCHYYGSCYGTDFVIAGHNYPAHFGRLPELQPEDLILFTDVSGQVHCYEVVLLETLPAIATGEMITSGFDLTLYTCTVGGANRVAVRCGRREQP